MCRSGGESVGLFWMHSRDGESVGIVRALGMKGGEMTVPAVGSTALERLCENLEIES